MPHQHCHTHGHEDSCCSEGSQHECHSGECHSHTCECKHHHEHEHHHDHEGFAHAFLELADEAWREVLKQKIKDQIIAHSGHRLDELAKLISETNYARWKNKMAAHRGCKEYEEKLCKMFSSH